jgi:hypothetical protein
MVQMRLKGEPSMINFIEKIGDDFMSLLSDIEAVVNVLEKIVAFIEKVDPNAANNPIFQDILKVLNWLKSLNL